MSPKIVIVEDDELQQPPAQDNGSHETLRATMPAPDENGEYDVTIFPDAKAKRKRELRLTGGALRDLILSESAPRKEDLPWIKLARFGDVRSSQHSLRHDANVTSISGTEIDYDGERIAFASAVEAVRKAGLRAVLYTSPSHSNDRPRWRILFPTSGLLPPPMRKKITQIADDILGGVAARESLALSQAYFFGQVAGREPVQIEVIDGDFIDVRLPAHDRDDDNPFTRVSKLQDFKPPIDAEARLAAMTHKGEGEAGINSTQLHVSAALLNQGLTVDDVVAQILEATQAVSPSNWDWRREEAKIRRMCETWVSKCEAGMTTVHSMHQPNGAAVVLDRRDPMAAARKMVTGLFTDAEGRRTLHRYRAGFWHYDGACYRELADEEARAKVWTFLEQARASTDNGTAPFKPDGRGVTNVLDALTAACRLDSSISSPCWLADADHRAPPTEYLPCANGLLHLTTGTLHTATPEFFSVVASGVPFDPNAIAPDWAIFRDQIFAGDEQADQLLQEWCGYLLSADTSQQKILLVVGPRRSGKGTIGRVLREVLGRDSVAGPTMSSLSENFGLEPLVAKSAAIISDARIGPRTNKTAIVERLLSISGEDTLTVDRKFRVAWHGQLPTRFMVFTNEMPALTDGSGALAGRFLVINLTRSFFGEEDHDLTARLLTNASGILNWALEGYRRLKERGRFVQPDSGREAIEEIEMLASPIKAFIRERCTVGPGFAVTVHRLWDEYTDFMQVDYNRDPGNKVWFSRNLRTAVPGLEIRRRLENGIRVQEFVGIKLRQGDAPPAMVRG